MFPILVIVFMEYLFRLVRENLDSKIFGYADDLALISETEETTQKFIGVWMRY